MYIYNSKSIFFTVLRAKPISFDNQNNILICFKFIYVYASVHNVRLSYETIVAPSRPILLLTFWGVLKDPNWIIIRNMFNIYAPQSKNAVCANKKT